MRPWKLQRRLQASSCVSRYSAAFFSSTLSPLSRWLLTVGQVGQDDHSVCRDKRWGRVDFDARQTKPSSQCCIWVAWRNYFDNVTTNNIYDYLWQNFLEKLLTIRAVADVRTHKHQAIYEMTWGQLLKTGKGDLCTFTQWVIASCASWHSLYKPLKIICSTSLSPLKALHIYCIFLPARCFACYQLFHKGEENLTVWTQDNQTVPSNFSSLVLFPCF